MKHNTKITIILIAMFLLTQIIGIYITSIYSTTNLPYGMQPPEEVQEDFSIFSLLTAFVIAIVLFFFLTKIKAASLIKIWFFIVTILAIALTLNAIIYKLNIGGGYLINFSLIYYAPLIALIIALPLAYFKIFKRNLIVHNFTELLIYPGIAAVFIPLVNVLGILILLLLISLYDIWAVWHSSFMQNMAEYQIKNLRIFTGFYIPYASKKTKEKIKYLQQKYKNSSEKLLEKELKKSRIKINLAILGGGDIIFPIITAGVFYKVYQSFLPSFIIMISATLALLFLFILAKKGKFYPAMPFLTIGMYLGIILIWLLKL